MVRVMLLEVREGMVAKIDEQEGGYIYNVVSYESD